MTVWVEGFLSLHIDLGGKEMNKIEELEQRCAELEDRVSALEEALVAALARPSERTVVVEKIQPVASWTWFLNGMNGYGGQ